MQPVLELAEETDQLTLPCLDGLLVQTEGGSGVALAQASPVPGRDAEVLEHDRTVRARLFSGRPSG